MNLDHGRKDGRTDGKPENRMPPAPKGGGIKKPYKNLVISNCNNATLLKEILQ